MSKFQNSIRCRNIMSSFAVVAGLLSMLCLAASAIATEPGDEQVFPSAAAAARALVAAAKTDDMNALQSILGKDAKEVINSGDPVADNNARDTLVEKYGQMHRLAYDDQGRVVLYIGADNWPFPIPLVKSGDGWAFDTEAGKKEMLYRRIGQNELYTIDVLRDLADAQREYNSQARDGGIKQFAQKIQSDPGKRNGLYWPVAAGEPESPIGPLIADATEEG
jgi:Protein of unknown function (DUF2950)